VNEAARDRRRTFGTEVPCGVDECLFIVQQGMIRHRGGRWASIARGGRRRSGAARDGSSASTIRRRRAKWSGIAGLRRARLILSLLSCEQIRRYSSTRIIQFSRKVGHLRDQALGGRHWDMGRQRPRRLVTRCKEGVHADLGMERNIGRSPGTETEQRLECSRPPTRFEQRQSLHQAQRAPHYYPNETSYCLVNGNLDPSKLTRTLKAVHLIMLSTNTYFGSLPCSSLGFD
jgi:hypothetical protein